MNILIFPILIPIIAGAVILIVPKAFKGVRELIALAGTILASYYAGLIFFAGREITVSLVWFRVEDFIFAADLRADSLSSFILFAAAIFSVLIVIYSIGFMKGRERLKEYYCYLLWTSAGAAAALLADNLLLLLIGWEITTALLFFMITMGDKESREAAGKTFVMIGFSDCALLLGILLLWQSAGTMLISSLVSIPTTSWLMITTYILLLTGALVKAAEFEVNIRNQFL